MVEQYHDLFFSILDRDNVKLLIVETSGKLPTMVGALGSMAEEVGTRVYESLPFRLCKTWTFEQKNASYWEAYVNPFPRVIGFTRGTPPQGEVIVSFPSELWRVPSQKSRFL